MIVRGLGTAVPAQSILQPDAAHLAAPLVGAEGRRYRVLEGLYGRSGVRRRHSVLLGAGADGSPTQDFFDAPGEGAARGPSTDARMNVYRRSATELAMSAATRALRDARMDPREVTSLVTVSCTGFAAPGVDIGLIRDLSLGPDVGRVNVGFMGCHGMFNGLEVARALVGADPAARVLVVSAELCTLHFRYGWESEALVANALFADGAAAMVCTGAIDPGPARFRIGGLGRRLFPDSLDAMTWQIGDHGFEMSLDPAVPSLIRQHAGPWVREWLARQGQPLEAITGWAVHPGGPRVLDAFSEGLGLADDCLETSRAVLADYGNMSSATIGFIIERMLAQGLAGPGIAVGFGPGLAGELFLFEPL